MSSEIYLFRNFGEVDKKQRISQVECHVVILLPFLFLRPITFQLRMGVVRAAPGSRLRSVVPCIPECYVCGVVAPLIYVRLRLCYIFVSTSYIRIAQIGKVVDK